MLSRSIFFGLLFLFPALALSAWSSPAAALVAGVVFGLVFTHPYPEASKVWSRRLLQLSVVGLGFGMDLQQVLRAGRSGFLYTLLGIVFAMTSGWVLGKAFGVAEKASYLISTGTAICGGSAIAAVGPVINASDEEMAVSIGTVFLLNAAGLVLFPPLGHSLGLGQSQFGLWAALAIHDTSSVVGAGAKYGVLALAVATTVKLARALWIVPLTLATATLRHKQGMPRGVQWPWFILFFLLAAVINSYLPSGRFLFDGLSRLAKIGLIATLFLIGTGITRASLRRVGVRPLAQGIALWVLVAVGSLIVIRAGWIAL